MVTAGVVDVVAILAFFALLPVTQSAMSANAPVLWSWVALAAGLGAGSVVAHGSRRDVVADATSTPVLGRRVQAALLVLAPLLAVLALVISVAWFVTR